MKLVKFFQFYFHFFLIFFFPFFNFIFITIFFYLFFIFSTILIELEENNFLDKKTKKKNYITLGILICIMAFLFFITIYQIGVSLK